MQLPVFSVVIPTFNRPEMLRRALGSVAAQTYSNFEVIVSDDGSSVDLEQVIAGFPQLRLTLVRGAANAGAAGARNRGIERASGHFVSFLDDDDEYLPEFLEATFDALQRCAPRVGYSWSNICNVRYAEGKAVARESTAFQLPDRADHMPFTDALSIGTGYGVTVRKDLLLSVGCFDSSLRTVEDTDLFLKLLTARIYPTLVPGEHVRVHHHFGERMTASPQHAMRIRECWSLLDKHALFFAQFPELAQQLKRQIDYLQREFAKLPLDADLRPA